MTVLHEHDPKTSEEQTTEKEQLGIGELLLMTALFCKKHANDLYGYACYLLFPILFSFATAGMIGIPGYIAQGIALAFFLVVTCFIQSAIIVTVCMRNGHPKKDPDARSVGMFALSTVSTLVITAIVGGVIELAGYVLLIIPGIIATILFTFAAQEVVLKGCGPFSALAASKKKVQPRFFVVLSRIFGLIGALMLLYFFITTMLVFLASGISGIDVTVLSYQTPAWLDAILSVLHIVFLPPLFVGHTLLYLFIDAPERPQKTATV